MGNRPPILLDFATSVIAQGKTRVAYNKREQLKPGQMIDNLGQPTTDPVFGVKSPLGALKTFGEHKGFGLALVCELLGGALSAGMTLHERSEKRRIFNGMLTILIDPQRIGHAEAFTQEAMAFVDWVKASPAIENTQGVKVAGEPERDTRQQRMANGVPVDENTWQEILRTAEHFGLDAQKIDGLARG